MVRCKWGCLFLVFSWFLSLLFVFVLSFSLGFSWVFFFVLIIGIIGITRTLWEVECSPIFRIFFITWQPNAMGFKRGLNKPLEKPKLWHIVMVPVAFMCEQTNFMWCQLCHPCRIVWPSLERRISCKLMARAWHLSSLMVALKRRPNNTQKRPTHKIYEDLSTHLWLNILFFYI